MYKLMFIVLDTQKKTAGAWVCCSEGQKNITSQIHVPSDPFKTIIWFW